MNIWLDAQRDRPGGRQEYDDDDDDDDDYEGADGNNYDWNDNEEAVAGAQHYGYDDYYTDDDEGDVETGPAAIGVRPTLGGHRNNAPGQAPGDVGEYKEGDEDFDGEVGYGLVKAFRGNTTGRKIKRLILNFCGWQLLFGFALLVIAVYEVVNFPLDGGYFATIKYGSSVLNLTWVVAFPSFLVALLSMMALRNWATLCTNRSLLTSMLRIYLAIFALIWIIAVWCAAVLFLTFVGVNFAKVSKAVTPLPLFISTAVFLLPYILVILYYTFDLHYLMDEIEAGGQIREPGRPPPGTIDLAGVTLWNSCGIFFCGIPFSILFALGTIIELVFRLFCVGNYNADRWVDEERSKKKGKGLCHRILKTIRNRCCCFCCPTAGGGGGGGGAKYRHGARVGTDGDDDDPRAAAEQAARERKSREDAEKEMKTKELEAKKRADEAEREGEKEREKERERVRKADEEKNRQREAASKAEMEEEARRAEEEYQKRLKEQAELEEKRKVGVGWREVGWGGVSGWYGR